MTGDRSVRGEMAVPRIEPSAGEKAYREIRSWIVSPELQPSTTAGKVSKTPVREAMARLSSESLVDFRARAVTIGVAGLPRSRRDGSACQAGLRSVGLAGICAITGGDFSTKGGNYVSNFKHE